jgi:SPP1 gp7 family putative phage head morphogenesis protein
MSSNDKLIDSSVRHQIFVQRFAGGQAADILTHLRQIVKDIQRDLIAATTLNQAQRLTSNLDEVQRMVDEALNSMGSTFINNMDEFAEFEAEFAVSAINKASSAVAVLPRMDMLKPAVFEKPMTLLADKYERQITLNAAISEFSSKKAGEVKRLIQRGYMEGQTLDQITTSVNNLVTKRTANQANSLVRTAINHISSEARAQTHLANADVLDNEKWVSTLDNRTTITCASLDGRTFPVGTGPTAPRHWRCRSLRVAMVNPKYSLLSQDGTRSSSAGQVSAKRTYGGWLKDQSNEFQDEVLGVERGTLFRSGKLSIRKFTDDSGKVYSLDKLRQLNPLAFE